MDTKDLEEIFQISPIIPSPFDGGGYGWGRTKAIWSIISPPSPSSPPAEGRGDFWKNISNQLWTP